jgi:hypothetical protein
VIASQKTVARRTPTISLPIFGDTAPSPFGKNASNWGSESLMDGVLERLNGTLRKRQALPLSGHPACYRLILQGRGPFAYLRR